MHSERAVEIRLLDVQRFVFGPPINAHLFYQAKIEKLGVMRSVRCLIRIGVKVVAGKVGALITVSDVFLPCAAEYIARPVVAQERNNTLRVSAPFTSCRLQGQMKSLGNAAPEVHVFIGEVRGAIETIQTARRSH